MDEWMECHSESRRMRHMAWPLSSVRGLIHRISMYHRYATSTCKTLPPLLFLFVSQRVLRSSKTEQPHCLTIEAAH